MSDLNQLETQLKARTAELEQALGLLREVAARGPERHREFLPVLLEVQQWRGVESPIQQQFMQTYAPRLGLRLGLTPPQARQLEAAAQVYRLGLLGLPEALVAKPYFALSADEREHYETYPQLSEQALARAVALRAVAALVRDHREWVNGHGPRGVAGDDIALGSQILGALSDYFDVWSGRLLTESSGKTAAGRYLVDWTARRYDEAVVQALLLEVEDFDAPCNHTVKRVLAELEPGMVLACDLAGESGGALLVAGTVLTEAHIRSLQRHASRLHHPLVVTVWAPCDL